MSVFSSIYWRKSRPISDICLYCATLLTVNNFGMLAKNIKYLRKKNGISQQELADALDVPRTTLGDYERGKTEPNIATLISLAECFDITLDALLREKVEHKDMEIIRQKDFRVLAVTVDAHDRENIELVDKKAEAGYLESFQDPEYISELPKIQVPTLPDGSYRAFEIQGDSMLPLEPGTLVICKYTESLTDIKDGRTFVLVGNESGIVYKRVYNDLRQKELILVSDNDIYTPFAIPYGEVREIWQYHAHIAFSDDIITRKAELGIQLKEIKNDLREIREKLTGN